MDKPHLPCIRTLASAFLLTGLLAACQSGGGADAPPDKDFPVNKNLSALFTAQGLPAEVADFFAAAKLDTERVDARTFKYVQTWPNGATRTLILKVTPDQRHTPTAAESASVAKGGPAVYAVHHERKKEGDGTVKIDLTYIVPTASLPAELKVALASVSPPSKALLRLAAPLVGAAAPSTAAEVDGAGIAWGEVARTGADVGIGSLIEAAGNRGIPTGPLSGIYSISSAASAIGGAMQLSQQTSSWFLELDALEKCAKNPTNPVAKSDPNYISMASSKVASARAELQEVGSARFLNQMNETAAGITPQTSYMSILLKAGFASSDAALSDFSENTVMREARLAVVSCDSTAPKLEGNVEVTWTCDESYPSGTVNTVVTIKSSVGWDWDSDSRQFWAKGETTYKRVRTSIGAKTCILKEDWKGSLYRQGVLTMFFEPAAVQVLGYDYLAAGEIRTDVAFTESCEGTSGTMPEVIQWLPDVQGLSAGGVIAGEKTKPTCIGINGPAGSEITKYRFAVPDAPK